MERTETYQVIVLNELIPNMQKFFAGGASPAPWSASNFENLEKKAINVVNKPHIRNIKIMGNCVLG